MSARIEQGASARQTMLYAELCGRTLAHAHAKSGDAAVISGYLGKSDEFDQPLGEFAMAYADQNEQDHAALLAAVEAGKVEAIQEQLWSQAVAAAEKNPESILTGLFLQSLNESIDLHAKRVFVGLYSRIPVTLWLVLLSLAMLGMISLGYQAGLSVTRRSLAMPIFALAFAGVLYLIVDLDRSHEGLLQIGQQALINLHDSMQTGASNGAGQ